jgi:voltage-gated potassium channel
MFDRRHAGGPAVTSDAKTRSTYSTAVERFEQRTEMPMAVLAVVFFVAYAWPILSPNISQQWKDACRITNYVIWGVFAVEFLIRIVLAEQHMRYTFRHFADVLMLALPVLRPLRVLRLLVLLQMLNRRASGALRGRVALFVGASAILVLFSAALAMLDAERGKHGATIRTFGDALWWAGETMTTVGYGDRVPITGEGRVVGFALMLAGIAVLGTVTASIASWLVERVQEIDVATEAATRGDIDALRAELAMLREAVNGRSVDG